MTDTQDISKITEAIITALRSQTTMLTEDEHQFIQALYTREQRRTERWEKIKTQVLGWGAIALVGWLGTVIFEYAKHLLGK